MNDNSVIKYKNFHQALLTGTVRGGLFRERLDIQDSIGNKILASLFTQCFLSYLYNTCYTLRLNPA